MTDVTTNETQAPAKRKTKKRAKVRKAAPPAAPKAESQFTGITATKCCDGCTAEKCLISTVAICKHPYTTADSGCGPITMKNRIDAKRLIKVEKAAAS